jgi:hypothetical protein
MVKWFIGARFAAFLLTRNSSFTTRKTRTECFRTRVSYKAFIACCICFMQTAMNEWKHEWHSLVHTALRTPGTHSSHVRVVEGEGEGERRGFGFATSSDHDILLLGYRSATWIHMRLSSFLALYIQTMYNAETVLTDRQNSSFEIVRWLFLEH